MKQLINYLLFLCIGCCFSFFYDHQLYRLLALLSAVILASMSYLYTGRKWLPYATVLFAILAALQQSYLYYLPLLLYCVSRHFSYPLLLYLLPILFHLRMETLFLCSAVAIFSIFAILLRQQWEENEEIKLSFMRQRDATKELADMLSNKNRNLLVQQEQEIRIAILDERNRIAREIHDNVGHLLSRCILIVGAMKIVNEDEKLSSSIEQLEESLNTAMTSVRESVHDLHDDSVNLREVAEELVGEFTFCPVDLSYDMGYDVPREIKYGFIAIVKEALHNIVRHSDASKVKIVMREHPALYQLIVEDNGTVKEPIQSGGVKALSREYQSGQGMGLRNMSDRVRMLGGMMQIVRKEGFRIFITIPKEVS